MNDPSTMRYYPRSLIRSLRDESQRFDEIMSAAITVEETIALIIIDAKASNWKNASMLYHEIVKNRAAAFEGTKAYPSHENLYFDLKDISKALFDRDIEHLEAALEDLAAGISVCRDQAADESPGEEGSDWSCY